MLFSSWLRKHSTNGIRQLSPRLSNSGHRPRLEVLEERTLLSAGELDPSFGVGGIVATDIQAPTVNDARDVGAGRRACQRRRPERLLYPRCHHDLRRLRRRHAYRQRRPRLVSDQQ
jgi:hypothetical protein